MTDFLDGDRFCDPLIHICKDLGKEIISGRIIIRKQCFMADHFIELHQQQESFLEIADHESSCVVRIFLAFYEKLPKNLLNFAGTMECMIQNMQRFSLVYFKYSGQVGTVVPDIYYSPL